MRARYCIPLLPLLAVLAACESDYDVSAVLVQWMEWPAEVTVATPFTVRLLVSPPACYPWIFHPAVSADQSAVTFAPYFLVKRVPPVCPPLPAQAVIYPVPNFALDTSGTAPGLATTYARTFEMRASANTDVPGFHLDSGSPVRTFGDVTVRFADPDTSRRNAGGVANILKDFSACVRVVPGVYPGIGFVLDDQSDTTSVFNAFVRGYLHDAAAPVCGQTRVFHLVSLN
jgi:hypothetical protein